MGRRDVDLHSPQGEDDEAVSLHPGGLALTAEMAKTAGIRAGQRVLDVASGTGASASMLKKTFKVHAVGLEPSPRSLAQARSADPGPDWVRGDGGRLPFLPGSFDGAYSECTLAFLDRPQAIEAMAAVVKPGGWVAMHDLCSPARTEEPGDVQAEDAPETLQDWHAMFEAAGLESVQATDKTGVLRGWSRQALREIGFYGIVDLMGRAWQVGGSEALWRVVRSTSLLESDRLAYGMVVGRKPSA